MFKKEGTLLKIILILTVVLLLAGASAHFFLLKDNDKKATEEINMAKLKGLVVEIPVWIFTL
ncbi:hypothetical protein [Bacillus mobilis]|uniref:hypothetical protein n=1 Tax=Bacillus mobilis TaxID=2026190 RepID=UPI0007AB7E5B|nr:hypothetical protein FOT98_05960 [Bacillus sp. HY001]